MIIHDRRQAEFWTVMANPDVERARLELQEGVIELRLEGLFALRVPDQSPLEREDTEIPGPAREALDVIEPQSGFLHGLNRVHGIGDDFAGGGRVAGDALEFEKEEVVQGPQRQSASESEERSDESDPDRPPRPRARGASRRQPRIKSCGSFPGRTRGSDR